ncbi:hypothetical protein OEA41_010760 [Lepraria neglecta]|uniref:Uncharacterized protein n=1 Tax=Lepraria neglecta TaxID=209136 RepID=A0AAD9Z1D7_9LECA|nr:hypothetical protein OEA41_010760 [Lepraria neglecta]
MAHIAASDQEDNHINCQTCARRSDWEFLKEFFNREELAKQQIQGLNGHVAQLGAALRHTGQTTQKDRIALNKSHDHMQQLQSGFNQSEAARARLENELHNERQEHRICQEVLDQERLFHADSERTLAQLSVQLKGKLEADSAQHTEEFMGQAQRIHELDQALQREYMKSTPRVEAPESSEFMKATKRRRRFRGRGESQQRRGGSRYDIRRSRPRTSR